MPTISLNLNATVTTTEPCGHCTNGKTGGVVSHCTSCGRDYSGFDWDDFSPLVNPSDKMPCGCLFRFLNEESEVCSECAGTGKVVREVPLTELFEAFAQILRVCGR